jgi:hypothetical protein
MILGKGRVILRVLQKNMKGAVGGRAAGPGEAAVKADMLRRRKEQQKQWQQRYRDQTKYLTARARSFLPSPAAGHFYTEADLLVDLAAAVRDAKAKAAMKGESAGDSSRGGSGSAGGSGSGGGAGSGGDMGSSGGGGGGAGGASAKGAASGLMYGSEVDSETMVSGLGRSVDPMFVLANKPDNEDARLAFSTVRSLQSIYPDLNPEP